MDTNKMRDISREQFEAFYAEYEKKREANGWMPLETHVVVHMRNAWVASREAVVVELPSGSSLLGRMYGPEGGGIPLIERREAVAAVEAQGLKVAP